MAADAICIFPEAAEYFYRRSGHVKGGEGAWISFNSPGSFGLGDMSAGVAVRGRVSVTSMQQPVLLGSSGPAAGYHLSAEPERTLHN